MALVDVVIRQENLNRIVGKAGSVAQMDAALLEQLLDAARWTRTHVDLELALQREVGDIRDQSWRELQFTNETAARSALRDFSAAIRPLPDAGLKLQVELRNLRARLDGLIQLSSGWWKALVEAPPTPSAGATEQRPTAKS